MSLFDPGRFYRPLQSRLFPGVEKPPTGPVEPHRAGLAPELARQSRSARAILARLQEGPATSMDLVKAGGGFRYSARLLELRQAGHNIEAISKGEGVWEYRLILP